MAASKGPGAIVAFFGLVCAALSITIITIIALELYPGTGYYQVYSPTTGAYASFYLDGQCLMTNNSINVCRYGYSVGVWGTLSSIVLMFAMCAPPMVSVLMSAFNTIWFMAFAITVTVYDSNIDDDTSIPERVRQYNDKYRTDVYAMAWTCFALSLLCVPAALAMMKSQKTGGYAEEKPVPEGAKVAYDSQPAGYPTAAAV